MPKYTFKLNGKKISFSSPEILTREQAVAIAIQQDPTLVPAKQRKSSLQKLGEIAKEAGPEIVGSTIGELTGFKFGGPPGAIAGAGLGAAIGKAAQIAQERPPQTPIGAIAEQFLPVTSTVAEVGLTPGGPQEVLAAGARGLVGGAVGAGIAGAAQKLISPFKKSISASTKRLRDIFRRVGGDFTPAQATDNKLIDFMEELTEGSFAGQAQLRTFKETQQKGIQNLSREIADTFTTRLGESLSDDAIGEIFLTAAKGGRQAHKAIASELYTQVDEVLKEAVVSKNSLMRIADILTKRIGLTKGLAKAAEIDDAIKAIRQLPKNMPFGQAQAVRSALLDKIRDLSGNLEKTTARSGLSKLAEALDASMETAGTKLQGDASTIWRTADKFYKAGKKIFENDFMANLIIKNKTQPAKIGEKIFARGNVDEVRKAKTAVQTAANLDSKISFNETWKAMQSGYFEKVLNDVTDHSTGIISGKKLTNVLGDRRTRRTLKEIFSKEHLKQLDDFARIAEISQEKTGATGAGVAIKLAQFHAGIGLLAAATPFVEGPAENAVVITSAGILLGPSIMAKLLTRPAGIKFLTEGFKLGPKGQAAFGRLPSLFSKIGFLSGDILNKEKTLNQ